eukprot:TRINITY_DN5599_c2_g1_i1.p1 TRINITY_DN5599_c2_g1~~TRINITY_DN5599_c2_g1_i1.p1  ORF type:complete len:597 (+),score=84.92 TRINITY_DN5599_c2_g1_i1:29-1792(+)
MDGQYRSRRSDVYATKGAVASSQAIASDVGLSVLKSGGNAVDACIAMAAATNVTQPCSTGIGGDAFMLYYEATSRQVYGLNGSGRSAKALTLEHYQQNLTKVDRVDCMGVHSPHAINVPGAVSSWGAALERFGTKSLPELLGPAIRLAAGGFPVSRCAAFQWDAGVGLLKEASNGQEMLIDGLRAPKAGEIMKLPNLAKTLSIIAEKGTKVGFYKGEVAEAIVKCVRELGGCMSLEDLSDHECTWVEPIRTNYRGVDVYEIPPNGQGIAALMALNTLEGFDLSKLEHNSAAHLHLLIESLRLAFADAREYVADPSKADVPIDELIAKTYADTRRVHIRMNEANPELAHGQPANCGSTVYFTAVDGQGNACSFIQSNYSGFGSGHVPKGCGFTLQNRGCNFVLDNPTHRNVLAGGKRSYHTIIPGMALHDGHLYASFGVMGGFMQPQGHVQVISNMIDFGMSPQEAIDAARVCIADGTHTGAVFLEDGIDVGVVEDLLKMGHRVAKSSPSERDIVEKTRSDSGGGDSGEVDAKSMLVVGNKRFLFGNGQIIRDERSEARRRGEQPGQDMVLCCGSDPRHDCVALGWVV